MPHSCSRFPSEAAQYEGAPSFSAAQALPGVPLRGTDYSIGDRVGVENFQYVFHVNTKWGPFTIKGSDLLRVRLREIAATAKLEEVNGAETAVESAGKTALRPLSTAKGLVTAPGTNDRRHLPRRRAHLRQRAVPR